MRKGLVGVAVGLAAAVGGTWAARRFLGSDGSRDAEDLAGTGAGGAGTATAERPRREGLDPTLLEILACPDDKQPVIYQKEGDAERLTCTKCGKRYPVRDGIPVMLIDEAQPGPVPTEEEVRAAKALAPEGKPAIVGAAAGGSSASGGSAGAAGMASGAGAAGTPSATPDAASVTPPDSSSVNPARNPLNDAATNTRDSASSAGA